MPQNSRILHFSSLDAEALTEYKYFVIFSRVLHFADTLIVLYEYTFTIYGDNEDDMMQINFAVCPPFVSCSLFFYFLSLINEFGNMKYSKRFFKHFKID